MMAMMVIYYVVLKNKNKTLNNKIVAVTVPVHLLMQQK